MATREAIATGTGKLGPYSESQVPPLEQKDS